MILNKLALDSNSRFSFNRNANHLGGKILITTSIGSGVPYISSGGGKKHAPRKWTAKYLHAIVCRTVKDAAGISWSVGTDQGDSNNSSSVSICWKQLLGNEACQDSSQGVHVGNSNKWSQLNNCCWKATQRCCIRWARICIRHIWKHGLTQNHS